MSLRDQLARLRRQFARRTDGRTTNAPEASSRRCLFEQLEKREMLAADPLRVGVLYTETDDRTDLQPDTFELSFVGGAPNSELRHVEIDLSPKRLFFDTATTGRGTNGAAPFKIVSLDTRNPGATVNATVTDGSSLLTLDLTGFQAGDKLLFSIDVDEDETLYPSVPAGQIVPQVEPNIDAIASGAEFNDSILRASFVAPHYHDASGSVIFKHRFNLAGRGLDLQLLQNTDGNETRSAAAGLDVQQKPKPVAISGTVYLDPNLNLKQESGEQGLSGVTLELWEKVGGQYVSTGHTTQTSNGGNYEFGFNLNLQPGTYQVRESQPAGLFSVGAVVGTVEGRKSGSLVPGDLNRLTDIEIPLGDTRAIDYDFAEAQPASLSGYVYSDLSNDGSRDPGELGIGQVSIQVIPVNTIAPQSAITTTTDDNGHYEVTGLAPGEYRVVELQQPVGYFDGLDRAGQVNGVNVGSAVNPGDELIGVLLTGGSAGLEYNFGEIAPASISGEVRLTDRFGNCDGDDILNPPLEGVRVVLQDSNGQTIAETHTDSKGQYSFGNLRPGSYTVVEFTPANLIDGDSHAGNVNATQRGTADGDAIRDIRLNPGDHGTNYDFCEHEPASLSGFVYHDRNDNGQRNAGESPIDGVTVRLLDKQGATVATTVTARDGSYRFEGLSAGEYRVVEVQPDNWYDGQDTAGTVGGTIVGAAQNPGDSIGQVDLRWGDDGVNYNFGELLGGSIAGIVHADPNQNCEFDAGEKLLSGVTVELLDAGGNVIATTQTDANGAYKFDNLRPGKYAVRELQPTGYFQGGQRAGSGGGDDSQVDLITSINVGSDQHLVDYDFCELPPSILSGYVHADPDQDCVFDAGETPLQGVKVELLDSAGKVIATTTTDTTGYYKFEGLAPGSYTVRETQPDGYFHGGQVAGSKGGDDSQADRISSIVIGAGETLVNYNFCELPPSSLSGYVHTDVDRDCVFDANESPIAGVKIELLDVNGNVVATTTTDAKGFYQFTNLAPGQYAVRETQPDGYFDGGQVAGSKGGDASGSNRITTIPVGAGETLVEYNFCELPPSSLSGFIYSDVDQDCEFDPGESPLGGVTVELLDSTGKVIATTTTDDDGFYTFTNLAPGKYTVRETQPDGYFDGGQVAGSHGGDASVTNHISAIDIGPGQTLVDYDFCELPPSSLTGFVHTDLDQDCVYDANESPIEGVKIELLDANGDVIATTTTDVNGFYKFDGLAPGTYAVRETQPVGLFHGGQRAGSKGGDDSLADLITAINVGAGETLIDYNFCEFPPSSLSGMVHTDIDNDCVLDANERPIAGVTVELLDASGNVIATTLTDAEGRYEFTNLRPGTYSVREIQPAGYFDGGDPTGRAIGGAGALTQNGGLLGGQLDGGLDNVGGSTDNDQHSSIAIRPGQRHVDYNFCEIPPASLAGRVFQDGDVLQTPDGLAPADLRSVRDGKFTSDDKPIAGVTLELRNGINGDPIDASQAMPGYYADGNIRVVTDANGNYEFLGLPPGNYAVYQIHPDSYADGLDTPGTTNGIAINPSDNVDQQIVRRLSQDPADDAIILIPLGAGQRSAENNFSEILVEKTPSIPPTPIPPNYLPPRGSTPTGGVPGLSTPQVGSPSMTIPVPSSVGGGGMRGYTWHLSVVNAGNPRGEVGANFGGAVVLQPAAFLSPQDWALAQMQTGQWTLVSDDAEDGPKSKRFHFGMPGAIPISGDFNGDGLEEIGVFYQGRWFVDLNGNGRWDEEDLWAKLGGKDDLPVTGDWDGDGKDDIGTFGPEWSGDARAIAVEPGLPDPFNMRVARPKNFPPKPADAPDELRLLKRSAKGSPRADVIDHVFRYGTDGDIPVAGDWNGDGISTIGIFRNGKWHLDMDGDGQWSRADVIVYFGEPGDRPVVGDFNGDGIDEIGFFRAGQWTLDIDGDRELTAHDRVFQYGDAHDLPIVGDWDGDGVDEPGLYREVRQHGDH